MPDLTTLITSIIAGLLAMAGTWLTIRGNRQQRDTDLRAEFTRTLIERVDGLEERVDGLNQRVIETVEGSEKRIDAVRAEMRKLLDTAALETATWRDRYYTAMAEYNQLKSLYSDLEIKYNQLKALHDQLQEIYKARHSPELEDTP